MMQEKKKLDATAEKYKEEMMRIYNKKRAAGTPAKKTEAEKPHSKPEVIHAAEPEKELPQESSGDISGNNSEPAHDKAFDKKKLMHPPMPKIPYKSGEASDKIPEEKAEEVCEEKCTSCTSEEAKFPTAEELISMDSSEEEKAVPAASMHKPFYAPDARFESGRGNAEEMYDDTDSMEQDGHMQGNYAFRSAPDDEYEKEFSGMAEGQGYLQAEVTDRENGAPIPGAAVVVLRKLGDSDTLSAILTTDSNGLSESISLYVPEENGNSGTSEPYEEYMITVYREGYYSVNMLPVPVFDTVRSIQPVEMIKIEN